MCPVCGDAVRGPSVRCGECDVRYHAPCWDYVGKCAIYGCHRERRALVRRSAEILEAPVEYPAEKPGAGVMRNVAIMVAGVAAPLTTLGFLAGGNYLALSVGVTFLAFLLALAYPDSEPGEPVRPGETWVVFRMLVSAFSFAAVPLAWVVLMLFQLVVVLAFAVEPRQVPRLTD